MRVGFWIWVLAMGCGEPAAAPSAQPPAAPANRAELPALPEVVPSRAATAPSARAAVDVAPLPALDPLADSPPAAANRNTPTTPRAAPAVPAVAADSPMAEAQIALAANDPMGVVRALEGRCRTPRELSLLIETYRSLGRLAAACRNMDLFTRRFPTAAQAGGYRQMLATGCVEGVDRSRIAAPPSEPAERATPMEEAREALARDDLPAVTRALEGRARNARELSLLIEAYRNLGNTRAACRNMDVFTRRYPATPQANNYRMILARTCN